MLFDVNTLFHTLSYFTVLMEDDEKAEIIMALDNPQEMKELGKQMKDIDSAVWNDRCQEVVEVGNMAKVIYR